MEELPQEKDVEKFIDNFSCPRDYDVETFLKKKALLFQSKNKAKTYFILTDDSNMEDRTDILAYFALSMKVLHIPEKLSKNQRKKIDGLYNSISEIPVYLIGQIAKNESSKDKISGKEIIEFAYSYVREASTIVGGRIILIELKNNDKLIKFYENNGFVLLPNKTENEEDLLQMVRVI